MRRPHRSIRARAGRRLEAFARTAPPLLRLGLRRLTLRRVRDWPVTDLLSALRGHPRTMPAATGPQAPEIVSGFDYWAHLSSMAEQVGQTLSAAGIEHVRHTTLTAEHVAVPLEDREAAWAALAAQPLARWWFAPRPGTRGPTGVLAAHHAPPRHARSFRLFRRLIDASGLPVAGSNASITVEFWAEAAAGEWRPDGGTHHAGTRVAPAPNGWAAYLTRADWDQAQRNPGHVLRSPGIRHALQLSEPVDIVYTWVDDTDPSWRERRASVDPTAPGLAADALDPARTRDNDVFRYSVRSLATYASWARHIWIVTDGQVPSWLDTSSGKVTVVPHTAIFTDPTALPTFNSHAIESQLHHIPGLAEHYLYLNDDFFFGGPVTPESFFHGNGLPKFMLSSLPSDRDQSEDRNGATLAARRGRELIEATFGRTTTRRLQHVPHAHRLSTLRAFEAQFPDDVARVARSRFRSRDDLSIPSELAHYYAYARDEAVPGNISFRYIDVGSPNLTEHLENLLVKRDVATFCLNDVGDYTEDVDNGLISRFLQAYYPVPSPFEREGR